MYERLLNNRQFLYERVKDPEFPNRVTWELKHRFKSTPGEFCNTTSYPYHLSPNFEQYIDIDRKNHSFVIRDTITEDIKIQIPTHLLKWNSTSTLPRDGSMFKWHDNRTLMILTSEGVEKLVDITSNFKELAYNMIP
jgi:hypothetical protein